MPVTKKLLLLPPIVVGVIVLAVAAKNRAAPTKTPLAEASRALRVIEIASAELVPRVVAYGTSAPGRVWRVVPEVSGRITRLDARVRPGGILPAGTEILHIDSATFALTVQRLQAEIAQTKAQLAELDGISANLRASNRIEADNLALAKKDLERTQGLLAKGSATARQVDQAQQAYLSRRQTLQGISNELRLLPSQRAGLAASLAVKQANLAQAQLDLAKTVIRAPFACRVSDVQLEVVQYVKAGEVLFEGSSIDMAEVSCQLTLDQARWLMGARRRSVPQITRLSESTLAKIFGGTAVVRVRSGSQAFTWSARLVRVRERVDQETRTVAFVLAVDRPYQQARDGASPPLLGGMYCEVELRGRPVPNQVLVPRVAIHSGAVFVVDSERRLRRRAVEVGARQGDMLVIRSGLKPGETIVVSDPTPAVEGGLTTPIRDEALERRVAETAAGQ